MAGARDVHLRVARRRVRITTVVRRRVAARVDQQRVAAARNGFQHAVQQPRQRLVDALVVDRVVARRIALRDALVVAIEHVQPALARLPAGALPARGRRPAPRTAGRRPCRRCAWRPALPARSRSGAGCGRSRQTCCRRSLSTSAASAAMRLTSSLMPWLVASTSPIACTTSPTCRFMPSEIMHEAVEIGAGARQHLARGLDVGAQRVGLAAGGIDQLQHFAGVPADVAGGRVDALGQAADLAGDHGEAPARVARPGGLDPGVQRQQLGLQGDVLDQLADVAHRARARTVSCPTTSVKADISRFMRSTRS